jgi:hypothetical protein
VSDEHYGKILHSFWTDPRIKRRLSREAKLLLCYYFSSPHKNMAGIYHCPVAYVADETGLDPETVRAGLQAIKDWVTFDPDTDEAFVHGLAETAIGTTSRRGTPSARRWNATSKPSIPPGSCTCSSNAMAGGDFGYPSPSSVPPHPIPHRLPHPIPHRIQEQ